MSVTAEQNQRLFGWAMVFVGAAFLHMPFGLGEVFAGAALIVTARNAGR